MPMAAIVSGTFKAVTSTSELVSGVYELSKKLLDLLKPSALSQDPDDLHSQFCIQMHIEGLMRPLELCVLWSSRSDIVTHRTLTMVEETLRRVCQRIQSLQTDSTNLKKREFREPRSSVLVVSDLEKSNSSNVEIFATQLDFLPESSQAPKFARRYRGGSNANFYRPQPVSPPPSLILKWCLQELEIAASQLNLTLTTLQLCQSNASPPIYSMKNLGGGAPKDISISTILRAARRLWRMEGRSGDLCLQPGSLYIHDSRVQPPLARKGSIGIPAGASAGDTWTTADEGDVIKEGGNLGGWHCLFQHGFMRISKAAEKFQAMITLESNNTETSNSCETSESGILESRNIYDRDSSEPFRNLEIGESSNADFLVINDDLANIPFVTECVGADSQLKTPSGSSVVECPEVSPKIKTENSVAHEPIPLPRASILFPIQIAKSMQLRLQGLQGLEMNQAKNKYEEGDMHESFKFDDKAATLASINSLEQSELRRPCLIWHAEITDFDRRGSTVSWIDEVVRILGQSYDE